MSLELIQRVKPTPAAALAKRARALALAGADIVNFASGDVDHSPPEGATEAAMRAASAGTVSYTNVDGDPVLKSAVAEDVWRRSALRVSDKRIIVSTGSKQSIFNALYVASVPGAEAIIPAPYWSSHVDIAVLTHYRPVIVPCGPATAFKLDGDLLEAAITPATRWLILTNPSSPVGSVYTAAELRELGAVLLRHPNVAILCDELYEAFIFDGFQHLGFAAVCPELADRIVTVGGVSKTYAMMGWRVGWAIGNEGLIGRMATLQSQVTSSPSTIGQAAAAAALSDCADHRRRVVEFVSTNRAFAIAQIERINGLRLAPGAGSIYLYIDVSTQTADDRALAEQLLMETGLVTLPGGDCGASAFLRINVARKADDLRSGLDRLTRFLSSEVKL